MISRFFTNHARSCQLETLNQLLPVCSSSNRERFFWLQYYELPLGANCSRIQNLVSCNILGFHMRLGEDSRRQHLNFLFLPFAVPPPSPSPAPPPTLDLHPGRPDTDSRTPLREKALHTAAPPGPEAEHVWRKLFQAEKLDPSMGNIPK